MTASTEPLRLIVARTPEQLADTERLRLKVYCEEERMLPNGAVSSEWHDNRHERTEQDLRLLVYAGREPVGTVRLNPARSSAGGASPGGFHSGSGLGFESRFALTGFERPGFALAEVTGYCVLRRFRGTRVTAALFAGLRNESLRLGLTHWIAAANMETDCVEDAALAYELIQARHLVSDVFGARARSVDAAPERATRFLYTPEERASARRGAVASLKLPRTLALFANRMGARFIGAPAYDRHFHVFAAPLAVTLAAVDIGVGAARALSALRPELLVPAAP